MSPPLRLPDVSEVTFSHGCICTHETETFTFPTNCNSNRHFRFPLKNDIELNIFRCNAINKLFVLPFDTFEISGQGLKNNARKFINISTYFSLTCFAYYLLFVHFDVIFIKNNNDDNFADRNFSYVLDLLFICN